MVQVEQKDQVGHGSEACGRLLQGELLQSIMMPESMSFGVELEGIPVGNRIITLYKFNQNVYINGLEAEPELQVLL
jgi:hypothetical protein